MYLSICKLPALKLPFSLQEVDVCLEFYFRTPLMVTGQTPKMFRREQDCRKLTDDMGSCIFAKLPEGWGVVAGVRARGVALWVGHVLR